MSKASQLLILIVLLAVAVGLHQLCCIRQAEYEKKIVELAQLRTSISEAEYANQQLKTRVSYLKTPQGVEEIARDKLGLVMPGELSFVILPAPKPVVDQSSSVQLASVNDEKGLFYQFLHAAFSRPLGLTAKLP